MATLQSYIDDAANITTSADGRTITITGDCNIDGALDALERINDGMTIIVSGSSGKLRSSAGASGTLGGGAVPLRIIERSDAHAYGNDNGTGSDTRFGGDATNALVYDHIIYTCEARTDSRSDFDFCARGAQSNGSAGAGVTFKGFRLVQPFIASAPTPFNHWYSQNAKMVVNPRCGYGLSIRNERNAHGIIIENDPNPLFDGLDVDLVDIPVNTRNEGATKGSSGRVVVVPSGTMTLFRLNTPSITESNNGPSNLVKLVNPGQIPTRTANWASGSNNGYGSRMEILRDVPFAFTGATPTGRVRADSQAASNGIGASAAIPASGLTSVRVRTHWSPYGTGAWTDTDSYEFTALGLGFLKYYSGSTSISVGANPATRNVALTPFVLPDGTAATSKTSGAVSTAADIVNALQTYASDFNNVIMIAPVASEAVSFTNMSEFVISTGKLVLDPEATDFISVSGGRVVTLQCASTGVSASNGITLLNLGLSYTPPASTLALINMPTTTSAGTSSQITISAHANEVAGVFKNDGTKLGSKSFASDGSYSLQIAAGDSSANTRIGLARAGYAPQGHTLDLSSGGIHSVSFDALSLIPGLDGTGQLYDSTANADSLAAGSIHMSSAAPFEPGDMTIRLSNGYSTAADVFKAYHDAVAASNGEGTRAPAFGRLPLSVVDLQGQPGNVFLGPDTILQRGFPASSNTAAFLQAFPLGGIGGNPVHDTAHPIGYQINVSSGSSLADVNAKLDEIKAAVDANAVSLQTAIKQLRHLATSLPLTFHEPLSPLCITTGLAGQEWVRDVEETGWGVEASGTAAAGDPEADGIITFDGNNSHIDYSLDRSAAGAPADLYTTEVISLLQIRPTSFHASTAQPLLSIGAMTISIAPSTGNTASLRVLTGSGNDTTAQINLNQWNDLVIAFSQNAERSNNPRVRISINGGAQETANVGAASTLGNNLFGPIGSNTENLRLGGHGILQQTSGFIGQARAVFVHPDNALYGDEGWEIPTGISWNENTQVFVGSRIMDRVEGIAVDRIEKSILSILTKSYTLTEISQAILSQPFAAGISAGNGATASLTAYLKWLAANVSTDDSAAIATAVRDVALAGAAAGSLGKAVDDLEGTTHVGNIASAVRAAILQHSIETGVSVEELWQAVGAAIGGKTADGLTFKALGGGDQTRLAVELGTEDGERTSSTIPDAP